jgi:hypothetical protein
METLKQEKDLSEAECREAAIVLKLFKKDMLGPSKFCNLCSYMRKDLRLAYKKNTMFAST